MSYQGKKGSKNLTSRYKISYFLSLKNFLSVTYKIFTRCYTFFYSTTPICSSLITFLLPFEKKIIIFIKLIHGYSVPLEFNWLTNLKIYLKFSFQIAFTFIFSNMVAVTQTLVILLFYIYLEVISCANILAAIPFNYHSHLKTFQPLLEEILKKGHSLTLLSSLPLELNSELQSNYTHINLMKYTAGILTYGE